MGGFFGTVSQVSCVTDLFYGTDYNSHLGTKRGGLATYSEERGFIRSIHNLESTYFRTKFEDELDKFKGNAGIGIISDTDAQPIIINSHLGRFAIVTVAKITNIKELEDELLSQNMHFAELSSSNTNQTELIALLIIQGKTFVEGIENVFKHIKGSCSMLLLTEDGSIIAARDQWGRTPVVIGKKEVRMLQPVNHPVFRIWIMRLTDIWVRAKLYVCTAIMLYNYVSRVKVCRFVRSCGCIMVSRLPVMKGRMLRKYVSRVA